MPDGSHAARLAAPPAGDPSLTEALERLLACAGRGASPGPVLRDVRALLEHRGLLRRKGDARPAARTPASA